MQSSIVITGYLSLFDKLISKSTSTATIEVPKEEFLPKDEATVPQPKPIITEQVGIHKFDFTENEDGSLDFVPSEKLTNEKALAILENEFAENPRWEVIAGKRQVEVPLQSRFGEPTMETRVDKIQVKPKTSQNDTTVPIGDNNLTGNEIDPELKTQIEAEQKPAYTLNGKDVSREYAQEVIENDPELEQARQQRLTELTPAQPQVQQVQKTDKPKSPTEFQKRLKAFDDQTLSIRDQIILGIASGQYKFKWKDESTRKGLGSELGFSNSQGERRARINILSNEGYTPDGLAHRIWEANNMEVDDTAIRDEIIDVLLGITSRKQALEELENHFFKDEKRYIEMKEAEYQTELKEQQSINKIAAESAEEDIYFLLNLAHETGISEHELSSATTTFDIINLLEEHGQSEPTDDNTGYGNRKNDLAGQRKTDEPVTGGYGEGEKPGDLGGTERGTQGTGRGNRANLPVEPGEVPKEQNLSGSIGKAETYPYSQRGTGQPTTTINEQIDKLLSERTHLSKERRQKEASLNERHDLFGNTKADPSDLFGGQGFDPSQISTALKSYNDQIAAIDKYIGV